jgi:hypothetical protein
MKGFLQNDKMRVLFSEEKEFRFKMVYGLYFIIIQVILSKQKLWKSKSL